MTQSSKAGYYELLSARLYKLDRPETFIDIKLLIHSWTLNESMNEGFLHGSINVIDAVGLFYNFLGEDEGIRGEEEIAISYRDYFGEEREHKFFVYAVSAIETANDATNTAIRYTLHFVSKHKFYTDRFLIRRSYSTGLISDYVEAMWQEFWIENDDSRELSIEDIEIEKTQGPQSLIIPNYRPEEAMHMMARKAYGSSETQTFRFFQNRDKYYFITNEQLSGNPAFPEPVKFGQLNNPDQTPEAQLLRMSSYISVKFGNHINTIQDMVQGAYYKSTTELDFMNRTTMVTEYRYLDDYENYNLPDLGNTRSKHTKEFVDKHFNNFIDTLVIKDYPTIGAEGANLYVRPHTYYNQIYNKKPVNFYHHNTERTEVKVYGRNSLVAGGTIELEVLKALGDIQTRGRLEDTQRSGKYLVESIENIFYEDMYYQVLTVSKSGIQGKPEPTREYERQPQTMSEFLQDKADTFQVVGEISPPSGTVV